LARTDDEVAVCAFFKTWPWTAGELPPASSATDEIAAAVRSQTRDHLEDEPMKLTTNQQISVDGVVQDNGVWARPLFDAQAMAFVNDFYRRADAFLFGRGTYDLFAGYWGVRKDLENPIVGALNTKPKYVASNTLTDPQWADTTVLSGDLAAAVRRLKATPGGELQVHGSGTLTQWLLTNDLVDEINLLIIPIVVGKGARLFPDTGPDLALELLKSRTFPRGITVQTYRPAGRPQYATN
jgi:dihydrofolate reductase